MTPACSSSPTARLSRWGRLAKTTVPKGAHIVDTAGKVIIPGLVDTHSHIGVCSRPHVQANSDGNEMTRPRAAGHRPGARRHLNPTIPASGWPCRRRHHRQHHARQRQRHRRADDLRQAARRHASRRWASVSPTCSAASRWPTARIPSGLRLPRGQAPGTRMKIAALQRGEFPRRKSYHAKWDDLPQGSGRGREAPTPPERDLALEPLVEVLEHKRTVHFHCHRADDIMTAVRAGQGEFDFELVIQHGTEAYKVAKEIAKHNVPVSMTMLDSPGGKAEVVELTENAADLAKAGVKVRVNTDDSVTESRSSCGPAAIAGARRHVGAGPQVGDARPLRRCCTSTASARWKRARTPTSWCCRRAVQRLHAGAGNLHRWQARLPAVRREGPSLPGRRLHAGQPRKIPAPEPMVHALPAVNAGRAGEGCVRVQPGNNAVILAGQLIRSPSADRRRRRRDQRWQSGRRGTRASVEIPADFPVISAVSVTPGLIDANSIVPLSGQDNIPPPTRTPTRCRTCIGRGRGSTALIPAEPLLRFLLEQGVTGAGRPGEKLTIAGVTGVFRTHGTTAESMARKSPSRCCSTSASAERALTTGAKPGTRMGTAALVRKAFTDG